MPIKGLTDRPVSFQEIGRIRKGAPKNPQGHIGRDLTYFRLDFDETEQAAAEQLYAYYGTKEITKLDIVLPFDEIDWMWDAWVEAYIAGGLVHRSDGERVNYHIDIETGERTVFNWEPPTVCPSSTGKPVGQYLTAKGERKPLYATPIGRLKVILPVLKRLAYVTLVTTSQYDIINISQNLGALKSIHGTIKGVPMTMERKPTEVRWKTPDGKYAKKTNWLIYIEANPNWVDQKLHQIGTQATPEIVGYLPEPEMDDSEAAEWMERSAPTIPEEPEPEVDIETGEIMPGGAAQQQPEREPEINMDRPYSRAALEKRITQREAFHTEKPHQRKPNIGTYTLGDFAIWMLSTCFEDPMYDDAQTAVAEACMILFRAGPDQLSDAQHNALLDWLSPEEDLNGDWSASRTAITEARKLIPAGEQLPF